MELIAENANTKKRKVSRLYNLSDDDSSNNPMSSQFDEMYDEVNKKLKRLKIQNSPLISPTSIERYTVCLNNKISSDVILEKDEIEEEMQPITDYYEINQLLGQIYYENKQFRAEFDNKYPNLNQIIFRDQSAMIFDQSPLDVETRRQIEDLYSSQNKLLNQLWHQRTQQKMSD